MFDRHPQAKRLTLALSATGVLALGLIAPVGAAPAASGVEQDIAAGALTASIADTSMTPLTHSHSSQNSTGTLNLGADDDSGSNAGWYVTVESSEFTWSAGATGATDGSAIPAADFSITTAEDPGFVSGDSVNMPTTGPDATGGLDSPRIVLEAAADSGDGAYTQALDVNLAVPANQTAGVYTATVTTTIFSGDTP
ncbi:MAG TPA: WxL domain-containing protein [Nitrolancea sp.]|jgi:hypothetical protein|nr:WxL domain-containing protein [Nitrolancea sp.]